MVECFFQCHFRKAQVAEPHFPVLPEFQGASYNKGYELFCQKMVREWYFTAACFLTTDCEQATQTPNYTEPCPDLSAANFCNSLSGKHCRSGLQKKRIQQGLKL